MGRLLSGGRGAFGAGDSHVSTHGVTPGEPALMVIVTPGTGGACRQNSGHCSSNPDFDIGHSWHCAHDFSSPAHCSVWPSIWNSVQEGFVYQKTGAQDDGRGEQWIPETTPHMLPVPPEVNNTVQDRLTGDRVWPGRTVG